MENKPFTVDLRPWEYEAASDVGIRRFTANWSKRDAPHYRREVMEDDRTAQVAAAICEIAVARATNRYWHGHVWHATEHNKFAHTIADVGKNIEVRRVRDPQKNDVAVRKTDLNKGCILFAAYPIPPEFRSVEIWGYISADEAWELAEVEFETYRRVHRRFLRDITEENAV